jgi:uncharacterized protein
MSTRLATPRTLISGLALGGAGLLAYATLVEPRWLQLRRVTVHLRQLPPQFEGLRIGLLTDLHAGGGTPYSLVRRAARMVMAERPDLIALTGDFAVDDAPGFARCSTRSTRSTRRSASTRCPATTTTSWASSSGTARSAAHPRIRDLTNAAVLREVDGARLCVAGVDDFYEGDPQLEVLPPPDDRDVTILLAHSPDQAERARRAHDRVDLIVSGHTHGGQVRLPWVGALKNSAEHEALYEAGLRRRPWTQVYVSRGVGTVHLPVRFLCRPEVTLLRLTRGARPPLSQARLP